jgi:hypothetical protein
MEILTNAVRENTALINLIIQYCFAVALLGTVLTLVRLFPFEWGFRILSLGIIAGLFCILLLHREIGWGIVSAIATVALLTITLSEFLGEKSQITTPIYLGVGALVTLLATVYMWLG